MNELPRIGNGRTKLSPPEIARRWGISPDKVLSWIRSGELKAIDASTQRGGRPRYLVDIEELAAFADRRAVAPPLPRLARGYSSPKTTTEFF